MQISWGVLVFAAAVFSHSSFAATVQALSGSVSVVEQGRPGTPLSRGELPYVIKGNQAIHTSGDGKARLVLDDGSEVSLAPGSEFLVPPAVVKGEASLIQLIYGKIRVLVRTKMKNEGDWQLRTGNAVMGVRGTEFIIEGNRDRTLLCTFEGVVDVRTDQAPKERSTIRSNEGVIVGDEGKVSAPVTMDPRQMSWWRQETTVDSSDSMQTRLSNLGTDWEWGGPSGVEYLDPNAAYSQYSMLYLSGALWTRVTNAENVASLGRGTSGAGTSLLTRGTVTGVVTPNRTYLLYLQGTGTVKSGHGNSEKTGLRINQAFVLARSQSTHSLAVGRQEWEFGDGLMVGKDPWNLFARSFDGFLATARTAPVRVRLFASMLEDRKDSLNFEDWMAGAYGEFSKLPLQLYGIWVKRGGVNSLASHNDLQARYGIFGERMELRPGGPFFINEEFAYERGTIGTPNLTTADLSATLAYVDAGVTWQVEKLTGYAKAVYLRASGNANTGGNTSGQFIPLFNDTHRFLGLVNAFPQIRNIQRAGASFAARYVVMGRPVTAQFDYSYFSRVEKGDTLYPTVVNSGESELGREADLQFGIEPRPDVFVQIGAGILKQGKAYGDDQPNAFLAFLTGQIRF